MRAANQKLQKYETIRVTPEAKAACLKAALQEGAKLGKRVAISDIASRILIEQLMEKTE